MRTFLAVLFGCAWALLLPQVARAQAQPGVAVDRTFTGEHISDYALRSIGATWAYDYNAGLETGDVEYVQSVWKAVAATAPLASSVAAQRPGATWLIGNEPDHAGQSNQTPAEYAAGYKALYRAIKAADPKAKVYAGGISLVSPLRLAWMDAMLKAYGEPFETDGWHIHAYILPEACGWGVGYPVGIPADSAPGRPCEYGDRHGDYKAFIEQVSSFRAWSIQRGYRRPVIVSEFGILLTPAHGYDEARIKDFMGRTFRYLQRRPWVARFAWFSANFEWSPGQLFDRSTRQPTALGRRYRYLVRRASVAANSAGPAVYLPLVSR